MKFPSHSVAGKKGGRPEDGHTCPRSQACLRDGAPSVGSWLCAEKPSRASCSKVTEKAMAPHSSTLAWKIPWTEEPGGLQSMGSLRVRHD